MQRQWRIRMTAALVVTTIAISLAFIAFSEDISISTQSASYHVLVTENGVTEIDSHGFNTTMNFSSSAGKGNVTIWSSSRMKGGGGYRFHNVSWYSNVSTVGDWGVHYFKWVPSYLIRCGGQNRTYNLTFTGYGSGGAFWFSTHRTYSLNSSEYKSLDVILNWTIDSMARPEDSGSFTLDVLLNVSVLHYNISWLKPYKPAMISLGFIGIIWTVFLTREWEDHQ